MVQGIHEGIHIAIQQGIHKHQPRVGVDPEGRVQPTRDRGESPTHRHHHDEQQAPPEDGHGITHQTNTLHQLVHQPPPIARREHAKRQTETQRQHHRRQRQFQGGWKARTELGQHRRPGGHGTAQVAPDHMAQVIQVLYRKRPIQPQGMEHLGMALRAQASLAGQHQHRVTGHQVHHGKGEQAHAQQGAQEHGSTAGQEAPHGVRSWSAGRACCSC